MYLTEIVLESDRLSVLDKLLQMLKLNAQILWGEDFTLMNLLNLIAGVIVIATAAINLLKWVKNNILKLSAPYREYIDVIDGIFGSDDVRKNVAKYYIPTRCQDKDPCNEEEIYEFNGKYVTEELIPFFCDKAFSSESFGKYYMILADSGMGKTTFLVRLYRDYVLRINLRHRKKLRVCFVTLTESDFLSKIRNVEKPEKTILLLDALDENTDAIEDCRVFLKKLLEETKKFNKIVITCRTQFFSNQNSEPRKTGLVHAGLGNKSSEFIKKYITPFSDREVKQYLRKRFRFRFRFRKAAKKIVDEVPQVMARPLILYWIDCLVDKEKPMKYSFQIYGRILDRWIERECNSEWNERETGKVTKRKLKFLSCKIAQYMLENKVTVIPAAEVDSLAKEQDINLEPILARSRSLLNRNSSGEYKFAHRSFLEFILAKMVYDNRELPLNEDFLHSMSGFRKFFCDYLRRDLMETYGEERLNRIYAEHLPLRFTLQDAFGPQTLKLYSVISHVMLDGFVTLRVKIAFFRKKTDLDSQTNNRLLLVQEIILGSPKNHYAGIETSRLFLASDGFYKMYVSPYIEDASDIRYIEWNKLPL